MSTDHTKLPCLHCGKNEDYHRIKSWRRSSDNNKEEGYSLPFAQCPGYTQKKCQRNTAKNSPYDGNERRETSVVRKKLQMILEEIKRPQEKPLKLYFGDNRRKGTK